MHLFGKGPVRLSRTGNSAARKEQRMKVFEAIKSVGIHMENSHGEPPPDKIAYKDPKFSSFRTTSLHLDSY